jgi:hypothetical protein
MADGPLLDVAIDNISNFVQNGSYVFFGDFGVLGDLSEKLSLGHGLFEGRGLSHIEYLPRYMSYLMPPNVVATTNLRKLATKENG